LPATTVGSPFAARDATNALLDALKREHGPDGRPDLAV